MGATSVGHCSIQFVSKAVPYLSDSPRWGKCHGRARKWHIKTMGHHQRRTKPPPKDAIKATEWKRKRKGDMIGNWQEQERHGKPLGSEQEREGEHKALR